LVIGINSYAIDPLQGCVRDAERFRDALVKYSGFQQRDITMLIDRGATYKAILRGIVEQYQKAQSGDLFVFYYSGHGSLFPDEQSADRDEKDYLEPPDMIPGWYDGAICPVDIDSEENSSGKEWENFLLDDTLAWHFSRFTRKGCAVIFISDSCHSGAQARGSKDEEIRPKKLELTKALRRLRDAGGKKNEDLPPSEQIEQLKRKLKQIPSPAISREVKAYNLRGQYLLFSSSRNIQESVDTRNGGFFTTALLEAMREKPNATYNEIHRTVAAKVKTLSRAINREQEPQLDITYYKGSLDVPFLSLPKLQETAEPAELKIVVKVLNQQGAAIRGANVAILSSQGATAVASGLTSDKGVFETTKSLRVADYRLRVERVGFTKVEGEIELIESHTAGKASFTVRLKKL
jgi:hypothetical protein